MLNACGASFIPGCIEESVPESECLPCTLTSCTWPPTLPTCTQNTQGNRICLLACHKHRKIIIHCLPLCNMVCHNIVQIVTALIRAAPTLQRMHDPNRRAVLGTLNTHTQKHRNGLLRTLRGFQKVLRRLVSGVFHVQGAQKRPSCSAIEGTLNT